MPSLDGAYAWLSRAEEHLSELSSLCVMVGQIERDAMVRSLRVNDDVGTSVGNYRFDTPVSSVPDRVSVLAGETIQALRRVLDYLVFEVAWLDSGSIQEDTQFPT